MSSPLVRLSVVICWSGLLTAGVLAQAPTAARRPAAGAEAGQAATADESMPIPPETTSVTKHDWAGAGQTIHYTATAGNLLIKDEKDKPISKIVP